MAKPVVSKYNKPTPKSHFTKPKNRQKDKKISSPDSGDYTEVTDVIVESPKENSVKISSKDSSTNVEKSENVGKLLKDAAEFDSPIMSSHHHHNLTKQNDTNCEKPVQLDSSDNAVVVSSVVIVVIASAMVVGVALVAMIAVVARHFQRAKNLNGGGAS